MNKLIVTKTAILPTALGTLVAGPTVDGAVTLFLETPDGARTQVAKVALERNPEPSLVGALRAARLGERASRTRTSPSPEARAREARGASQERRAAARRASRRSFERDASPPAQRAPSGRPTTPGLTVDYDQERCFTPAWSLSPGELDRLQYDNEPAFSPAARYLLSPSPAFTDAAGVPYYTTTVPGAMSPGSPPYSPTSPRVSWESAPTSPAPVAGAFATPQ